MYIALIAMYLVLIIFFFPETRYVLLLSRDMRHKTNRGYRGMTIEQIGVLFDTGRKGDADAAAAALDTGVAGKEAAMREDVDQAEKQPHTNVAHKE